MRRRTASLLAIPLAVAALACGTYTPPAPPPPAPMHNVVHASFDSAWIEAVGYLADAAMPILVIDKPSGVITTRAYLLTSADSAQWADCGRFSAPLQPSTSSRLYAAVNLFMRDYRDSVTVRVNLTLHIVFPYGTEQSDLNHTDHPIVCTSTGRFEEGLVKHVELAMRPAM